MEWFNYLLKVSACSGVFFAFYLLVLRRLTFFKINRFYLLFALLLSFVIPTLQFTVERELTAAPIIDAPVVAQNEDLIEQFSLAPITAPNVSLPVEQAYNWLDLLPFLYGTVVVGLLGLATWRFSRLIKHAKQNTQEINGLKLVHKSNGFTNCSFFNYVFIDENSLTESELQIMLRHEEVHAKQYHSVDKIILIIVKAVLWFNPIVYLYDKALEQIHEYQADEVTSLNFGTASYANLLLRLAVIKSDMPLVHNFVKSPIKERIKMLFNSKSKHMKKLLYLLALPIGMGLLWGFTVDVVDVLPKAKPEKEFTLILDAGHGGKLNGVEVNGHKEKDIALAFAKKIKALAEAQGIKVVTTRDNDENISLHDRAKAKGDYLLSIHVNSEPNVKGNGTRNGIEIYTPTSDRELIWAKSNSMQYYLYEQLKSVAGISTASKPKQQRLLLLQNSSAAGVLIEMGYLTNQQDLKIITDETKQNELADAIVKGITVYRDKTLTDEELEKNNKSYKNDNSSNSNPLWGKTIEGKVKSILQTEVGEILNLKYGETTVEIFNHAKGKVKVGDELLVTISGTVDDITVKDTNGKIIKRLEKPSYGLSMMKTKEGEVLYQQKIPGKGLITKTYTTDPKGFNVEEVTLNTLSGKPISIKVINRNKQNAVIWIYVNDKLYSETEALRFNPNFIAKLPLKRGYSFATDFNIPAIGNEKNAFVFWFGNEPKLSDYTAKNRTYWEKYNGKTVEGKVIGYTFSPTSKVVDGFLVKTTNGETLKANVEAKFATQTQAMIGKDDQVSIKIYNANYWKDTKYPVLTSYKISKGGKLLYDRWPKTAAHLKVTNEETLNIAQNQQTKMLPKPTLLSSARVTIDAKNNISYIQNGTMEIYGEQLIAEDITWDMNKGIIKAENATLTKRDGAKISSQAIEYDLKKGTYISKSTSSGSVSNSSVFNLFSNLNYQAMDSTRVSKTENTVTLYGKAKVNLDGKMLSGDKIEVNKNSAIVTAYNAELTGVDKEIIKAKVIAYNTATKKIMLKDVLRNGVYWDRVIN